MFNRINVFFREAIYNPAPWNPAAQWIEESISIPPKLPSGDRCVHGLPQCRHSHKTDDYEQEMLLKGDRALLRCPSVVHRRFAEKARRRDLSLLDCIWGAKTQESSWKENVSIRSEEEKKIMGDFSDIIANWGGDVA